MNARLAASSVCAPVNSGITVQRGLARPFILRVGFFLILVTINPEPASTWASATFQQALEAHVAGLSCVPTENSQACFSPQLRPSANVYDLAKNFNLEVSLFERLVKVNIPFVRLNYQVRDWLVLLPTSRRRLLGASN